MPYRFGYYIINSHIDDTWEKSIAFCQHYKNAKIKNQFISENSFYRELEVRHGMSIHPYGTSIGETYEMTFGYHPDEKITYVSVKIKFSYFGRGFPWLVPRDVMKKWAYYIGTEPVTLNREQNSAYLEKINEIFNLSRNKTLSQSFGFCPFCGHQINSNAIFCGECGTNLVDS